MKLSTDMRGSLSRSEWRSPVMLSEKTRTQIWKVALVAFLAMCANDVAGTVMVVFEAHYNAALAGLFDVIGWFFALICSALAIESIITEGWRTRRSLTLIGVISAANFLGTVSGVALASALSHH
jgi:hypothetical protein